MPDLADYFKKGEDLDLNGNKLIFNGLEFEEYTSNWLRLQAKGTSTEKNLSLGTLLATAIRADSGAFTLQAAKTLTSHVYLQGWNGSALVSVVDVKSATTPYFEIMKAGDIIPATTLTHNLGGASNIFNQIWGVDIIAGNSLATDKVLPIAQLKIPTVANADAVNNNMRYDPATDTFEIYGNGAWNVH